jgi:hypothetical protein
LPEQLRYNGKDGRDSSCGHRDAFRAAPESLPEAQRSFGSRCHSRSFHEATKLHSLHIPSDPIASTSCKSLSERTSPPARQHGFQRSKQRAQDAMERRAVVVAVLQPPGQGSLVCSCFFLSVEQTTFGINSTPFTLASRNGGEACFGKSRCRYSISSAEGKFQGYSFRQSLCQQQTFPEGFGNRSARNSRMFAE